MASTYLKKAAKTPDTEGGNARKVVEDMLAQMVLTSKRLEARGAILVALGLWVKLAQALPPGEEQETAGQVCQILSTLHTKVTE